MSTDELPSWREKWPLGHARSSGLAGAGNHPLWPYGVPPFNQERNE